MVFDYRIVKLKNGEFMIGEVYYDDESNDIIYWCSNPVECWGETLELLKEEIKYINDAFEKPILQEVEYGRLVELD